jgi:hypothetical protein
MRSFSPSRYLAIALLLILAFLQLSTLSITSPTMDEPDHIVSGYAFLTRGDTRIKLNGPILPNLISAIPLLLEPNLKLTSADDPMWDANDHNGIGDPFIWDNAISPFQIIFLARLLFIFISWLLGALIFRWASERAGSIAGLFALTLYVFDPSLLAHSRFAMTDFEPTAAAFFALYAFDRALRQTDRKVKIIAGVALGLMLASKFSLITFAFAMIILIFLNGLTTKTQRHEEKFLKTTLRLCAFVAQLFFIAAITIWAVYGFQVAPLNPGGLPVPAPGFWREWQSAQFYLNQPWPNYLFGQTSITGWWYYFPIAFALKTPLPILILLTIALARSIVKRSWRRDLIFLLPSLLLFISLLFSTNNLGYRYLLPMLPLVFVYIADVLAISLSRRLAVSLSPLHLVTLSLIAWQIFGALHIYPYYLTYFNEIAGDSDRGRYALSDSNIDWGQDLVGLKSYVDQHHIDQIKLSYFGIAHPTAYNLKVEALLPVRTALNDQGAWWLKKYTPIDPAPGTYAISVANLMGGIWIDSDEYRYFRDRTPEAIIGNSIYIYTIGSRGEPTNLSLAGLQIDQIDTETYRLFETNDIRPRWFDATSSLIAAPNQTWLAVNNNQPIAPEFSTLFEGVQPETQTQTIDDHQPYRLYHFDLARSIQQAADRSRLTAYTSPQVYPDLAAAQAITLPVNFGETAQLIGYNVITQSNELSLITYWRAGNHVSTPLQMFAHAVGPGGSIEAQVDQLDASAFGWRAGDLIAQINRLALSTQSSSLWIEIGLYNQSSGDRLPIVIDGREVDHRLLLLQITTSR